MNSDEHLNLLPANSAEDPPTLEEILPIVELVPGGAPEVSPPSVSAMDPVEKRRILLGLLFANPDTLSAPRIAEIVGLTLTQLRESIEELRAWMEEQKLPFRVEEVAGGFRLLSHADLEPYIVKLQKVRRQDKLSQAALETLALIAYRQPLIKAEIEAIRGVQAGPILKALLDRRLIKVVGRAKVPGSPLQYGTTPAFLDRFGLKSLDQLPTLEELKSSS